MMNFEPLLGLSSDHGLNKELYMIRAKNGPLANIDDFFPVGRVSGNMFIYT